MKFMKLGHRPDTFYTTEAVRCVSSEVSTDLTIQVKGSKIHLHKFPLLSKCGRLQRLCSGSGVGDVIRLPDFPDGMEALEACAKFCYGITITVSPYNIIAVRCAAEYLEMTEGVEKGNLVGKIDAFLTTCVLRGWKDSIIALQSTKAFSSMSEELGITSQCIDAVARKITADPAKPPASSRGWWGVDIAELGVDHYWRVMSAVKASGRFPASLIGKALQVYARRWLPNMTKDGKSVGNSLSEAASKHRLTLESIITLLPPDKGSVPCSFLLKLLKSAAILNAPSSSKTELAKRAGLQLDEATVGNLLIPISDAFEGSPLYDVDIVLFMVEQFMVMQGQSPPTSPRRERSEGERRRRSRSAEDVGVEMVEGRRSSSAAASHSAKLKVAKLVDGYLGEVARDEKLTLEKVVAVAGAVPEFARPEHDDLYRAIDVYLKAHPNLSKNERKQLCRILDCKKLSMEACMHAAQNELLPLRVVVQVLFFEYTRSAMAGGGPELTKNLKALLAAQNVAGAKVVKTSMEEEWSISGLKSPKPKVAPLKAKLVEDIDEGIMINQGGDGKAAKPKFLYSIPVTPKKMLSKLWPMSRSVVEKEIKKENMWDQ